MSLPPGTRLGQYEVLARLGAGGMGEVYKARDTRLGREVALKTLPDSFTHDPERLARFRREAQVLAAINHPHIGGIYGFEEADGQRFLILELVDGETLAARIQRGPLPVEEALAIAREIAEALEAAHEKGIVHRDLKPANIALTAHDSVKVLDFGLAKATGGDSMPGAPGLMNSPTVTSPLTLTGLGVILGTAAYMSPEQARGRAADKRSDVWAFGSVLYEMLTGRRAFQGDDVTDTLAAVMRSDPDWSALPASLHPAVRALLQGCLEKDRRKRIGDVSAALFVLGQQGSTLAAPSLPVDSGRQRSWQWPLLLLGGAVVGAMATGLWMRQPLSIPPVTRFTVQVPEGLQLSMSRQAIAISPDGSRIVIGAQGRLFLRSVAEFDSRLIPTAEVAIQPAFSPDGQSILFWADGALKRMAVTGGVPVLVCEATPAPFGVSWGPDGILFLQPGRGIMRVSPNGGTPTPLLSLTEVDGLATRAHLLPDGDTLLFTLARGISTSSNSWDRAQIVIHSLRSGQRRTLIEGGSDARFVPTGHIVYSVEGTVMAVPFDVGKLQVTGGPVPIVEGVRRTAPSVGGEAQFVFSASGTLVYLPGPARTGKDDLFLYDRKGDLRP